MGIGTELLALKELFRFDQDRVSRRWNVTRLHPSTPRLLDPLRIALYGLALPWGLCRLLEIRMILHPDRLAHHPRYEELSLDQKEQLAELWHRLLEVTPDETGYADDQIGGTLRSLTLLDNMLNEAKAILAHPGIDTDAQLIPQGDTLDEQMAWLDAAIDWIDGQTASVTAEVYALERDDTLRKREALLSCIPERKAQVRKEMEALAKEYNQEANELEAELDFLLAEVEHDQAN